MSSRTSSIERPAAMVTRPYGWRIVARVVFDFLYLHIVLVPALLSVDLKKNVGDYQDEVYGSRARHTCGGILVTFNST